nr:unnamed protein product [Callosobruchus analis]
MVIRYHLEYYEPYSDKVLIVSDSDLRRYPFYPYCHDMDEDSEATATEESTVEEDEPPADEEELSYGEMCRCSERFEESVEELRVPPLGLVQIEFDLPEDVLLWKAELSGCCCEEEEVILESQEVLKTLELSRNEEVYTSYLTPFPVPENTEPDSDVEVRQQSSIRKYRVSKTTDFDFRGKVATCEDFDIRGCSKMQLPNKHCVKLKKYEIIRYQNENIYKCDESNLTGEILYHNVILKSARLFSKREIELRDVNNKIFVLYFDSSKDARSFIENDKLSQYTGSDNKSTITKALLRLLGKRASREMLEKKGIYQNEPIFGNTLSNLFSVEYYVPRFILKTMSLIEKPENICSVGIYRTSGNLATIQKIRFEVDKGRLDVLDNYARDPDVLTGCLKLFFRELREPLIPCRTCESLLKIMGGDKQYSKKEKDEIRSVIKTQLQKSNFETLQCLIRHLLEVVKYKDQNKMDTYNLAVCWGPTIIFAGEGTDLSTVKDIVTQSAEATKLFEALLIFYMNNPEELEFGTLKNSIQRYDSKDSIQSSDSNDSRGQRKIRLFHTHN